MSKFLKLLAETHPSESEKHNLLRDITSLLSDLGFSCKDTEEGIVISIPEIKDEDQEAPDALSRAVGVITTVDKALPETPGGIKGFLSPQARRIKAVKRDVMDALQTAVLKAASDIKKSVAQQSATTITTP